MRGSGIKSLWRRKPNLEGSAFSLIEVKIIELSEFIKDKRNMDRSNRGHGGEVTV